MATITMQRDLVVALKRETILNVGILSKLQPMSLELSRHDLNENWLEKPTQNLFNHLSYYLVHIIDPQASKSLSWPLYDTKTERAYRNELSSFISNYSNKGLLSPVMSSYLVNPGCFKVTMLLFQMSQLAVKKLLTSKMKDSQKKVYNDMTYKYKLQERESFFEEVERETDIRLSKFSNYLIKRKALEDIAAVFRKKISDMESKLKSTDAKAYLDNLVDTFVDKQTLDDETKTEISKVKNVYKSAPFFDKWFSHVDKTLDEMESKWSEKMSPFTEICQETQFSTESLIARHTGAADKNTYMIEYNHKTDEINTNDLENQVTSQQKYILKNIVNDERLNFPNLIRSFLIAISFILKKSEVGDEIYKFNDYFNGGRRNYCEVVDALKELMERVMNAEALLQPSPTYNLISIKDADLPPPPDLSDLRLVKDHQCQILFDSFTPLSMSKHQFNLRTKTKISFIKPQSKYPATPYYQKPKEEFMRSLISSRVSNYDQMNTTQNFHNMSAISQYRSNETIAECSTGFTNQHLTRLLSIKKSSSSKKFKHNTARPDIVIKKGGLFNETSMSTESNGLFRSISSPNLFENRDKKVMMASRRKLSVMKESSQSPLEVSGIEALDKDFSQETSKELQSSIKLADSGSSVILITPGTNEKFQRIIPNFKIDLDKEISIENIQREIKTETPKTNAQLIRKTSSLEKIINRFKKVRANVLPEASDNSTDIRTIVEEKENNMNVNVNIFTANRVLLPDLLSPSCSVISKQSIEFLDQICMDVDDNVCKKSRQSLGTALGVDQTFLDQFDLID